MKPRKTTKAHAKNTPASEAAKLLEDALHLTEDGPDTVRAALTAARRRLDAQAGSVLISGLRSVGKSSFVCALWGDAGLLPTAVRDCTQTNTRIREPASGEADRRIVLSYLTRERAMEFAARSLAYHRLEELLHDVLGPQCPRLDELAPEERLRIAADTTRKLFAEKPAVAVLYEPLTEPLEQIEQFRAFLDDPAYRPGETAEAPWDQRRDYLMGRRRPDGRTLDVGKLLSLREVEVVRAVRDWPHAPHILDTPWIPSRYDPRRADLAIERALETDALAILSLPETLIPEDWVSRVFQTRPELARRTFVVFNQIDTVDPSALFGRQGFADGYRRTLETMSAMGVPEENFFVSCAQLPLLRSLEKNDADINRRIAAMERSLDRIRRLTDGQPDSHFRRALLTACDPADAGMVALRRRIDETIASVRAKRVEEARASLEHVNALELPSERADAWNELRARAAHLR